MSELIEEVLTGTAVSEGIAIGAPFFFRTQCKQIPSFSIHSNQVDAQIARYRDALFSSRTDLMNIRQGLSERASCGAAEVIESHLHMLEDPLMTEAVEERIRSHLQNPEAVVDAVITDYEHRFSEVEDPFFRERLIDVKDLAQRVLGHLGTSGFPQEGNSVASIPLHSVVFALELTPSEIASAEVSRCRGLVTALAGGHSHTALLARAKGIPYVAQVQQSQWQGKAIRTVIVDGFGGKVILNPSAKTLSHYERQRTRLKTAQCLIQQERQQDAQTADGYEVCLYANMGSCHEWEEAHRSGAEGVGLFRSEYLCLEHPEFLDCEEAQYCAYKELIERLQGRHCVIRAFDLGGDKVMAHHSVLESGERGIRLLLARPQLLVKQLRALLRAATYGPVSLLLPLVSDPTQVERVRQWRDQIAAEFTLSGVAHCAQIPIGCMIELPAAALICDVLAKSVDFFSIGTNDLTQFTLGIDRMQLEGSLHPSLLRMIKGIVVEGRLAKKEVTLCGELGSNPLYIPLLLGLGVDRFSCSARYIPLVKRAIRNTTLLAAHELAEHILTLDTTEAIAEALVRLHQPVS